MDINTFRNLMERQYLERLNLLTRGNRKEACRISGLSRTRLFELMKKHPQWGVEILSKTDMLESVSLYPVLQHHERGTGRGYPHGISLRDMHEYSRIVAIVDTFDAMTTKRVYQNAIETFPALKVMFSMPEEYDQKLLKIFAELMGPDGLKSSIRPIK